MVIPALLPNEKQVRQLMEQIEAAFLGNLDDEILFAVAGDSKGRPGTEKAETDEAIIEAGCNAVRGLNDKYAEGADRFYFFVRERKLDFKAGMLDGVGAQARGA